MLRIYTGVALVLAAATGVLDAFARSVHNYYADCSSRTVICTAGDPPTAYYWLSALGGGALTLFLLLVVGFPIILAGRIGKTRNRRGYPAGFFFSWLGLLYIVLR